MFKEMVMANGEPKENKKSDEPQQVKTQDYSGLYARIDSPVHQASILRPVYLSGRVLTDGYGGGDNDVLEVKYWCSNSTDYRVAPVYSMYWTGALYEAQ